MNNLKILFAAMIISSCQNSNSSKILNQQDSSINQTEKQELPFIGKKSFETRVGISGTGTPHKFIEILKNGDVFFSFDQENQADGTTVNEKFYAGKFKRFMFCTFKKLDNDTIYYEITKERIYEVDIKNQRITSDDCCNSTNIDMGNKCPCEGDLLSE